MRRAGALKNMIRTHTIVQRKMKHFIRIAAGISFAYLQFATENQTSYDSNGHITFLKGILGGIGQGGGAGPLIWITVTMVLLAAYRTLQPGATMVDILGWYTFAI